MVEIKREVVNTLSKWEAWRIWELSGLPCGAQVRVEQRKFDGGLTVKVKDPAPFAEVWEENGEGERLEFFMFADPEVMFALVEVVKEAAVWEEKKREEEDK